MAGRDQIVQDLQNSAGVADGIGEHYWADLRKVLYGSQLDQWIDQFRILRDTTHDRPRIMLDLVRATLRVGRNLGPGATLDMARVAVDLARRSGAQGATSLLSHAPRASVLLGDEEGFHIWLASLGELAASVPEAAHPVCIRTDTLLSVLDARGFRAWLVSGLAEPDPAHRLAYYQKTDQEALDPYRPDTSSVRLGTMERKLKAMSAGLWKINPLLRPAASKKALHVARRASFDGPFIRLPETFAGYSSTDVEGLFKAAVAHIGAHNTFTLEKFEVKTLKPIQIALVSAIEDARVELLAGRQYPGLLRLWKRFHIAGEADGLSGPNLAEPLMARLARALIDPEFRDDNPWIVKACRLFAAAGPEYDDPEEIRRIGVHLGNDLGQMRIQFNAKTYVVQPPYRDDNLGIWDFGPPPPDASPDTEMLVESMRVERQDEPKDPPDRQRNEEDSGEKEKTGRVRAAEKTEGVPVAKYPEWDFMSGRLRQDWTTLVEYEPRNTVATAVDRILARYADTETRIEALVRQSRVSRPVRLRRQAEGDRLDLDAAIGVAIDMRAGLSPEPRVYETTALLHRDLSILVLLDISESTKDTIRGGSNSVFSMERAATALLAEAMAGVGDPFAVHAFCSDGRNDVRYYRIKDFGQPYNALAKARLGGLRPGYSTRLGAALRHAGSQISAQQTHRRLILVVTDGEPSDIDVQNRQYLVEDARKAVHDLGHIGINVFGVGLTGSGEAYLGRIFGRRNWVQIPDVQALPERLPMLYFRLTA